MSDPDEVLAVVLLEDPDPEPVAAVLVDPAPVEVAAVVAIDDAPPAGRGAVFLDDLRDVDAPPAGLGVLERQDDGRVRPVTRDVLLAGHVESSTPHPAYDDMPDLTLIFENGLV